MGKAIICSFSGQIVDLPELERNPKGVLEALRRDGRVSTFDMSENPWLWSIVRDLKREGLIKEAAEPYPWHRFNVVEG